MENSTSLLVFQMVWRSVLTVALTREQAVKVKEACQQLLQEKAITIREVAKVLGLLTSSLPEVLYRPLHYRSLEMDKTQALKSNQGNFDSIMALSGEAVADLQWWINSVEETSKGSPNQLSRGKPRSP